MRATLTAALKNYNRKGRKGVRSNHAASYSAVRVEGFRLSPASADNSQVGTGQQMNNEVLAIVEVSAARRWMGVIMLAGLGGLVIYVALATPPKLHWQAFLIVVGVLSLWMADRLRRATEYRIELTETELRSSDGQVIALVSEIEKIDRGVFAFKPSNGFLVRTLTPGPRAWRPGLWWRMGRRIGVGGVTAAGQTKGMSEILAAMIAQRDQESA
jgi:hypothetical protein